MMLALTRNLVAKPKCTSHHTKPFRVIPQTTKADMLLMGSPAKLQTEDKSKLDDSKLAAM